MKVSLIDYTGAGASDPARHAAEVLVFTKNTRLNMDSGTLDNIKSFTDDAIYEELQYMANTIPSSWEFVEYKFLVNDVTRAYTHQAVRTRPCSFAQQTMRVLDVEGWRYESGPTIQQSDYRQAIYDNAMYTIDAAYRALIDDGAKVEDARGVLPTNIHTNIVIKFDLRTLTDTMRKRASLRTQDEYRAVLKGMKEAVIAVHPWASLFFERTFDTAAAELEGKINEIAELFEFDVSSLVKLLDQMRATA